MGDFDAPPPIWERLGRTAPARSRSTRTRAGRRRPPPGHAGVRLAAARPGRACSSGRHATSREPRLESLFGTPEPVDEVFGQHRSTRCWACAADCSARPAGWPTPPSSTCGERPFDLAWLTFCAAHVAGHQFWDLSLLDPTGSTRPRPRCSAAPSTTCTPPSTTRPGRILGALPESRRDGGVARGHGHQHEPRRHAARDARSILDPRTGAKPAGDRSGGCARACPRTCGRRVARVLPERVALDLAARPRAARASTGAGPRVRAPGREPGLRASQPPWPRARRHRRTRRGRRVAHRDRRRRADVLDLDGNRRWTRSSGSPTPVRFRQRADLLPDLIVRWTNRPRRTSTGVHSTGSGRCASRGRQRSLGQPHRGRRVGARRARVRRFRVTPSRPPRLEDIAATAAALAGVDVSDLTGEPLLAPAR